ncbi:MAG: SprB repeat-containing protein, partial [Flavobacteriales bacterium]
MSEPSEILANENKTQPSCEGTCDGTITVSPSGGTSGYTYQWYDDSGPLVGETSAILSNICTGNYSVLITDAAGCDSLFEFT